MFLSWVNVGNKLWDKKQGMWTDWEYVWRGGNGSEPSIVGMFEIDMLLKEASCDQKVYKKCQYHI